MKIQIKSDLHLEQWLRYDEGIRAAYDSRPGTGNPLYLDPDADVLVLAGDIINVLSSRERDYLKNYLFNYGKPVIYVLGNHESYGLRLNQAHEVLKDIFYSTNVHVLDQYGNSKVIHVGEESAVFAGGTLWTPLKEEQLAQLHMGNIHKRWSDFTEIREFNINEWRYLHNEVKYQIGHSIATYKDRTNNYGNPYKQIVVTHHMPSAKSTPEQFKGDPFNIFFSSDILDEMLMTAEESINKGSIIKELPQLWIHGHTHDSFDYMVGPTRVVCNPYGYFPGGINPNYENYLTVEV